MKNYVIIVLAVAGMFPTKSFAQGMGSPIKIGITQLVSDALPDEDQVIIGYRVEERINMNFGGRVTTYTVSNLNMVSRIDLGPNNSRTITPIYAKARVKPVGLQNAVSLSTRDIVAQANIPQIAVPVRVIEPAPAAVVEAAPVKAKISSVNIDILYTYERTLEKGYRSVDMLRRVANARFFEGNLVKAEKWYTQLFEMTSDIETVIYFRYAQSLKAVNKMEKANEMMKIWESRQ